MSALPLKSPDDDPALRRLGMKLAEEGINPRLERGKYQKRSRPRAQDFLSAGIPGFEFLRPGALVGDNDLETRAGRNFDRLRMEMAVLGREPKCRQFLGHREPGAGREPQRGGDDELSVTDDHETSPLPGLS